MSSSKSPLWGAVLASLLAAWSAAGSEKTVLERPRTAIPEAHLLDVHVVVLEPAPDFLPEVREAEARFVAYELKKMLERSEYWGTVRVVPSPAFADLTLTGRVKASHGGALEVRLEATDASGKKWVERQYRVRADPSAYTGREMKADPFEELYHRAANDLSRKLRKRKPKELARLREIAELRFASELAPTVFVDYLRRRRGRFRLERLPAVDDPMMERVAALRVRDQMFLDAVDAHYESLHRSMLEPYHGWRSQDYWQREAMRNGPPSAQRRGGGNAPYGVLTADGSPWGEKGELCGTPGILGRGRSESEDLSRWEETRRQSHLDVLRELGLSLAADVAPLLEQTEGELTRLSGTVEAQYARWRELLKELFRAETGLVGGG